MKTDTDRFYNFDSALEAYRGKSVGKEWTFVPVCREHLVLQASLDATPAKVLYGIYANMEPGNICGLSAREMGLSNGTLYVGKLKSLGLVCHTATRKISLPAIQPGTSFLNIPIKWFRVDDETADYCGLNVWDMQLFLYLLSFHECEVELSQVQYAKIAKVSRQAVSKRPSVLWNRGRGRTFFEQGKFASMPTVFDVLQLMKDMQTEKRVSVTPAAQEQTFDIGQEM